MNIYIRNPQKADAFAAMFQNIRVIAETVNVTFDEEKMYIQTMDAGRVSIFELTLSKAWFCEYACEVPVTLGVNVAIIYKILAARDKTQEVHLQYDGETADQLSIHMTSSPEEPIVTFDKHFTAPLMEIECEMMGIPEIEYQVEMSMPSPTFATLIHQLRGFGDSLEIQCTEDRIQYIANSQEMGSMSVEIKIDDLVEFSIEEDCELKLSFGITYLHAICSYGKIAKDVEIKMHRDYPLCIAYRFEGGCVQYNLAPKISGTDT